MGMEAIKKKMQAMKVEKDNLMDRCDNCEQAARDAKVRQGKTEGEATELSNKAKTLEVEVDVFGEKLSQSEMKQKAKEAQVMAAEAEFVTASQKLDKAATTADDSDRMKKVLENRAADDEAKLIRLADELKSAQKQAEDADKMYDETQKKMQETEKNLETSDERASVGEFKIIELEEELKVVANNLRSLEVSEDKANKRESHYKDEIKRLTVKLKQSETRSEFAERSVVKLQKEVDRLEDELLGEQEKFKAITEELDQTFAEMSGY